jgi:hypothetical protein
MVEMTRPVSVSHLGSEFDAFLLAPIGEERNGMLLTVLSVLARLDVDPWQEAARLARLPGETATQRLASVIAALPDRPSTNMDPRTIAVGLIALLPRRIRLNTLQRETLLGAEALANARTIVAFAVILAFALGAQYLAARRQPSAQVDDGQAHASSAVSPKMPPLSPAKQ